MENTTDYQNNTYSRIHKKCKPIKKQCTYHLIDTISTKNVRQDFLS